MIERVEPGFFEADEEGYWQGTEEAGTDGKAVGIEFCLYVQNPEIQLTHYGGTDKIELTDDELALFPTWVEKEYPGCDWNFDAEEHATASFYGEYQDGEDNNALMMRVVVNNSNYHRVYNELCMFYWGLEKFLMYVNAKNAEEVL